MTMYYRHDEEEGGGGAKARPTLDHLRDRRGSNQPGIIQSQADVR